MFRLAEWWRIGTDRRVVRRALITAACVGTILTLINHPSALLSAGADAGRLAQVALTFLVPYFVSTATSVATILAQRRERASSVELLEREIQAINRFPDSNPNPVMRIGERDQLMYANAAAESLRATWGAEKGDVLRPELLARLRVAASNDPPAPVQVEIAGGHQTFAVLPVAVPDLRVMNLYGTDITAAKAIAKFPDQNPNPVLRLSREGTLLYANPAGRPIVDDLGATVGEPAPAALWERASVAVAGDDHRVLEVTGGGRLFEIVVRPVYELGFINLYGTDVTAARQVEQAHRDNERLLLNILPPSIVERLRQGEMVIADRYDEMSVLFADVVDFTRLSASLAPSELVEQLNRLFGAFDALADRHGLEKIKTIGDAYMVVGGLSGPAGHDHAEQLADMALAMLAAVEELRATLSPTLAVRIGMHVGPAVAGVIGVKKFIYDVWGDTVNMASRMEHLGTPGRVQVAEVTFLRLRNRFAFEPRGVIEVKGKGDLPTWYLLRRIAAEAPVGTG